MTPRPTVCLSVCSRSLKSVRSKVWEARVTRPLFSCSRYAVNLERLLLRLWERYQRGEKPDHLTDW